MPPRPKQKRSVDSNGQVSVHGKSPNGAGSFYALPNGTWRASFVDADGRRRYVRGRTRAEAASKMAERIEAVAAAAATQERPAATTLSEAATWWLDNVAAHRVRESSLIRYRARVKRIQDGPLGGVPLAGLRPEDIAEWTTTLTRSGLGPKTISDVLTLLRQILDQATELGWSTVNVAKRVPNLKTAPTKAPALTVEDARALIAAARNDDRYGAAIGLLFVNGWRVSEVLGLAWEDIDLDAATARVQRAAIYVEGKGMVFGPTKNEGALGVHPLSAGVVEMLRDRKAAQDAERAAAGVWWATYTHEGAVVSPVFTNEIGGLLRRQSVTKAIKAHAAAAGIDPSTVSTHTGRRTVVTALYAVEGIDLADIARHVGHASTATTAGYVKGLGSRPAKTAEAASRLLDS